MVVQISFDGLYSNNLQKFLCKTCAIKFLMSKASQKARNYANLTTEIQKLGQNKDLFFYRKK